MNARPLVLLLFFLSGGTGLVYQVIWTRQLSLLLGVTVFAAAAVLAAFMGGLALGSYLFGRIVDRHRNPVRVYALLEAGIGLSALLVPLGQQAVEPLYVALARALEGNFLLFNFCRVMLAGLLLLLPTTLMGGTVPAIGRFLVRSREDIGWNVGLLYAVNTFGAVLGCLLTGFVLIPQFHLSTLIQVTAGVNLAIAAVLLLRRTGEGGTAVEPSEAAPAAAGRAPGSTLAVLVFAASGFAALGYEILWTRTLVVHLHNSSYAFTVMLAVFLTGLTFGDALLMREYDRIRRPLLWLGLVQALTGLSVVVAVAAYTAAPLLGVQSVEGFGSAILLMALRAGIVLLPSAILLGMMFPLVARIVCGELRDFGRHLGGAYAANTAGAIAGALGTAFVLIPALGLRGSLVALSVVNLLLGAACIFRSATARVPRLALTAAVLALTLVPSALIPPRLFADALESSVWKLVYYREGVTDTTGVWEDRESGDRIVTYGDLRGTAGTLTGPFNRREAHLAHLLHPNPTRSLQIGFGVGNSLAAAALHPEVEQLDCVELSPHVFETASYFPTNDDVLANPKVEMIIDDGRNFLLRNRTKYDVVIVDPPEIFTANVVNLYTVEFYRLVADSMADDGLLVQWIPSYTVDEPEIRMMVRSMLEVFPHTSIWRHGLWQLAQGGPPEMLVIGSRTELKLDAREVSERMRHPALRESLAYSNIPSLKELLSLYIAGPERLRPWVEGVAPVVDDRTFVDFYTPRQLYAGFGFSYVRWTGESRVLSPAVWGPLVQHRLRLAKLNLSLQEPPAKILRPGPEAAVAVGEAVRLLQAFAGGVEVWERRLAQRERDRSNP